MINRHTSTWSSWFLATGLSLGVHALAVAAVFVLGPESRAKPGTTTIELVNVSFGSKLTAEASALRPVASSKAKTVKAVEPADKIKPVKPVTTEKVRPDPIKPEPVKPDLVKPDRPDPETLQKVAAVAAAPIASVKQAVEKAAPVARIEAARVDTPDTTKRASPAKTVERAQSAIAARPAADKVQQVASNRLRVKATDVRQKPAPSLTPTPQAATRPIAEPVPLRPIAQKAQNKPRVAQTPVQTIVVARAEVKRTKALPSARIVKPTVTAAPSQIKTLPPKTVVTASRAKPLPPRTAPSPAAAVLTRPKTVLSPRASSTTLAKRPKTVASRPVAKAPDRPVAKRPDSNVASAVRTETAKSVTSKAVQPAKIAPKALAVKPTRVARLSSQAGSPPVVKKPDSVVPAARVKASPVTAKPVNAARLPSTSTAVRVKPVAQDTSIRVAAIDPADSVSDAASQASTGTGSQGIPLESLQSFDAGDCMLILPKTAGLMRTAFSAFGVAPYAAERFQREMERRHAADLSISMRPMANTQCAVTEFVRSLPSYPLFSMRLDLDRDVIKGGETLQGNLLFAAGQVSLILIDDDGLAHNVNRFLKPDGLDVVLSAPMNLTGAPVRTTQIFLAIAAPQSLDTLADPSSRPATDFFRQLSVELQTKDVAIDVAVAAFRVE